MPLLCGFESHVDCSTHYNQKVRKARSKVHCEASESVSLAVQYVPRGARSAPQLL